MPPAYGLTRQARAPFGSPAFPWRPAPRRRRASSASFTFFPSLPFLRPSSPPLGEEEEDGDGDGDEPEEDPPSPTASSSYDTITEPFDLSPTSLDATHLLLGPGAEGEGEVGSPTFSDVRVARLGLGLGLGPSSPPPRRVALLVEPSPWLHPSSPSATRYLHTIRELVEAGDEVLVLAPGPAREETEGYGAGAPSNPATFAGARVVSVPSSSWPWPNSASSVASSASPMLPPLALPLLPQLLAGVRGPVGPVADLERVVKDFRPDLVHAAGPGPLACLAATRLAKGLRVPLVLAYHVHVLEV